MIPKLVDIPLPAKKILQAYPGSPAIRLLIEHLEELRLVRRRTHYEIVAMEERMADHRSRAENVDHEIADATGVLQLIKVKVPEEALTQDEIDEGYALMEVGN